MKQIEEELLNLKTFAKAKANLEQYTTPARIAANIVTKWEKHIKDKTVLDLGAGTGTLGIAALLAGAQKAIFVEKDLDAAKILKENLEALGLKKKAEIVVTDINLTDIEADITIMNPPFGTRKEHADREFLDYALSHSNFLISIHKTSTLDAITKHIKGLGAEILDSKQLDYRLEHTMEHHRKEKQAIEVSLVVSALSRIV